MKRLTEETLTRMDETQAKGARYPQYMGVSLDVSNALVADNKELLTALRDAYEKLDRTREATPGNPYVRSILDEE